MHESEQIEARSWFDFVLPAALVLAAIVTLGSLFNYFALDEATKDLDAGSEASFNNWITVAAAFAAAVASGLHAIAFKRRRGAFVALTAMLAFLSLDDSLLLHERLGGKIGVDHIETVIFAPLYFAVLLIVLGLARETFPRAAKHLRLGVSLLVAAVVIDLGSSITQNLQEDGTVWPQVTRIAIEEGFEVAGWVALSTSLLIMVSVALIEAGAGAAPDRFPPSE